MKKTTQIVSNAVIDYLTATTFPAMKHC